MSEHGDHDASEERRESNPEHSDEESDNFQDANNAAPAEHSISPTQSMRSLTPHMVKRKDRDDGGETAEGTPPTEEAEVNTTSTEELKNDSSKPKSPLLTDRRLSVPALEEVSLGEGDEEVDSTPSAEALKVGDSKPALPSRSPTSRFMGLSGALPNVAWAPPPPLPPATSKTLPAPPAPTRKLTSPFSWLSRNSHTKESVISPTLPPVSSMMNRRDTVSSIATTGSNPEMMLNKLEDGQDTDIGGRNPSRNSLRDRFKLLRLREEAGITSLEEEDESGSGAISGRSSTLGLGVATPTLDDLAPASPGIPLSPNPATNPALAPGTAAGATAGPSTSSEAVDWDLWQSVVNEGPAAVARTSPEELNRAIATGIPNVIRGVVWQVLAQSKNDELESVYRDLVSRGTDKDKDRMSTATSTSNGSSGTEKQVASSASSVHSDDRASLGPNTASGLRSPSPHKEDPETTAKAQAAAVAEKKRKAKEDTAALQKLEKTIKRDLGARTSFSKFAASAGLQEGLFGVCKAYALFDEGVGYAQGMNFLAMPLLFNMPEEEAFCLLVRLMNQYHLRDLFIEGMPGLHMHLYQFERLLEDLEPALYCHLSRRQVTPHLYATQWFLTLFAYRFPLQLVLRIYDLILSEGLEAILKFGIVLMQKNAATLLAMNDMVALTSFLKDKLFDVYIDQTPSAGSIMESGFFGSSGASIDKAVYHADMLVEDACAVKITPELLKTYTVEWEEKTRIETAREAEVDGLKTLNAALSLKVRRLEERIQEHDTEHAALATELVRTKVENEELKEDNETQKGTVAELRKVVESQPEEVEARLKSEMERLMKRNEEVHSENSKLEEEMMEMEKVLVETKMGFAQVREENETMTQRLNNMRRALD